MGCDVHMFAEVKKAGKWEQPGKVFVNQYYREDLAGKFDWNTPMTASPYDGRNYDLFAILADVRNGRGFAGIKTGEGFNPISEPKGLPDDVSDEIRQESDEWDCDGHSHSWFTLKELLDYDWTQITMNQGYITLDQFKRCIENNEKPANWCGGIGGSQIVTIEMDEAEKLIAGAKTPDSYEGKQIYVLHRWSITYADHCEEFLQQTIPALQALGDPEDVRIVFWFDN